MDSCVGGFNLKFLHQAEMRSLVSGFSPNFLRNRLCGAATDFPPWSHSTYLAFCNFVSISPTGTATLVSAAEASNGTCVETFIRCQLYVTFHRRAELELIFKARSSFIKTILKHSLWWGLNETRYTKACKCCTQWSSKQISARPSLITDYHIQSNPLITTSAHATPRL
jgi:hypothetical protein